MTTATGTHPLRIGALALGALLFLQAFFYVNDFPPLYVLAKVVVPLAAVAACYLWFMWVVLHQRLPWAYRHGLFLLPLFAYLVCTSVLASWAFYGQPVPIGLTGQVKLVALFFFFPALFLLRRFRVGPAEITSAVILLGLVALVVYYAVNLALDPKALWRPESALVVYRPDQEAYRFRLPEIPLLLFLFLMVRLSIRRLRVRYVAGILLTLFYLVQFHQQRMLLAGVVAVLALIAVARGRMAVKAGAVAVLAGAALLAARMPYAQVTPADLLQQGSLAVRMVSAAIVLGQLQAHPVLLLTGAGNLSALNGETWQSLFGASFWLSDLGWLGLTFEFGIVGALALAVLLWIVWRAGRRAYRATRSPVVAALTDYVLLCAVLSPVSPRIAYQIGVFCTLLAVFVHLERPFRPVARFRSALAPARVPTAERA